MLTYIYIQGLKGFRHTRIPELRRVNLIVGGQNSGKTSLLEAVWLGCLQGVESGSTSAETVAQLIEQAKLRLSSAQRAKYWVRNNESINSFIRSKLMPNKPPVGEKWRVATFNVYPIEEKELVDLYVKAVRSSKKITWIDLLKKIEPRLKDLDQFPAHEEEESVVHANVGFKELIPISELGQGFNRLAYLYAGLLGKDAQIALIDEIENGIHYSALPILWQGIANIARELDIQIFATTHSKECIRAASDAFKDSPDDFQVIRLVRTDNNVEAQIIPAEYVEATLEMRGELR
ncbi:MAG: AAA family ATPase [Cytophagales bacterium]|nr:AAA family ATPase [Cytophagales bacterium]